MRYFSIRTPLLLLLSDDVLPSSFVHNFVLLQLVPKALIYADALPPARDVVVRLFTGHVEGLHNVGYHQRGASAHTHGTLHHVSWNIGIFFSFRDVSWLVS